MGGDGSRATIQKGPVHQAIDDLVNRRGSSRQALLNDLKGLLPADDDHTIAYLDVLKHHLPGLDPWLLDYLNDRWYNPLGVEPPPHPRRLDPPRPPFWPLQYHPTEPIVRKGLIKAIELAIAKDCPLDSYWMTSGERFETIVIQSAEQITRLLMTPSTPPPWPPNVSNSADIWTIKRGPVESFESEEDASGSVILAQLNIATPPVWR